MKKSATKLSRGRKRQAGGAKKARGSIAPPMVRAGKRPKLSETDRERVWEKVNPLMYRVHHGQPSLEEIVSCLAEYDDKSRPLRDFITGWAVQWLGGIKLKKRRNVRGQPRSRPERIRLTLPDILEGLAYMGEATAGALLDDVAIAWLKHDGSYVVDPQMKERLAAYRQRVEAKDVEMGRSRGEGMYEIRTPSELSAPGVGRSLRARPGSALERERVELPKEFAGYQAELGATPRDQTARRDRLQWEMRRVQKRMARVEARLGDLQAGRFAAK